MQQYKRITSLALALLVATVMSSGSLALAHGGSDDAPSTTPPSSGTTQPSESATEHVMNPERKAEFRKKAEDDIAKKRSEIADKKAKNSQDRKNACESHKQGLTNKFSRIVANGKKHQARIDKFLDKATAYKDNSGLSPENWDTLLASAQAAKATSAASIADLKAIAPTIDCNSTSVASDVATFKAAAAKVRDDLKAYKTSVKALLKSLRDAKPASESEGTNQ